MSFKKPFDRALYEKYDNACKVQAQKIFSKIPGYTIEENDSKIGVDFLLYKDDEHIGYLEVELKNIWTSVSFPYEEVNFPHRKIKFCELDKPTLFMMFNKDFKNYLVVDSGTMLNSDLEEVRNKYILKGELFFKVDKNKVLFGNMKKALTYFG